MRPQLSQYGWKPSAYDRSPAIRVMEALSSSMCCPVFTELSV